MGFWGGQAPPSSSQWLCFFIRPVHLLNGKRIFLRFPLPESLTRIKINKCLSENSKRLWIFLNQLLSCYRSRNWGLERSDSQKGLLISKRMTYTQFCRSVCVCVCVCVQACAFLAVSGTPCTIPETPWCIRKSIHFGVRSTGDEMVPISPINFLTALGHFSFLGNEKKNVIGKTVVGLYVVCVKCVALTRGTR